jgi:hypothetical protein
MHARLGLIGRTKPKEKTEDTVEFDLHEPLISSLQGDVCNIPHLTSLLNLYLCLFLFTDDQTCVSIISICH